MADVISDAGPLIAFAKVDLLFVLRDLFAHIRVPRAVWAECHGHQGQDTERLERAAASGWLEVVADPEDSPPYATSRTIERHAPPPFMGAAGRLPARPLASSLGGGEVAAIHLALASQKALLIVDDRIARRAAKGLGLDYIGTVRTLLLAERNAIIPDAEAAVEGMAQRGYRISPQLLRQLRTQTAGRP